MDRPPLGSSDDVPEHLVLRGMALEELSADVAEDGYRELISAITAAAADAKYDLLALGDMRRAAHWEFLGFDVGERTPASWSAIAHRDVFLSPGDLSEWERRLNSHGLFDNISDAEVYLALYLDSDDPDKGWTAEGWVDKPDIYAVIPVYRFRQGSL
jgi:hypothetical protein